MKLYKVKRGILVEREGSFYLQQSVYWDAFVNDDQLYEKLKGIAEGAIAKSEALSMIEKEGEAPVQSQEVWAAGVTYYSSKMGRQEESAKSGGSDFYARVYEADRPELFF